MSKVLVDIYHLPQFNFFKHAILSFAPEEIDVYCVNRGKLYPVIKHELPGYNVYCLGDYKHNKGMGSMVTRIIIPRMMGLYRRINKKKYSFILTANYQANFIGKIKGIPNIAFNDDPRRFVWPFLKFSADKVYLPPFGDDYKDVNFFNALKEWAYLSPKYFNSNVKALLPYGLKPNQYIFIREVSTKTSNYLDQQKDIVLSVAQNFPKNWPVVLSLENKENTIKYPDHWIILKEPVEDIHSLMYFAKAVISSGDSMAREGAMLGVPSIYVGSRFMPANDIMINKKMMWKIDPENLVSFVHSIWGDRVDVMEQEEFRDQLKNEWDDVTELILSHVAQTNEFKKKAIKVNS